MFDQTSQLLLDDEYEERKNVGPIARLYEQSLFTSIPNS